MMIHYNRGHIKYVPDLLCALFCDLMHISTACPGGTPPGQLGGNEGEFGILSVYSAREPRGNYKLRNNRTTGGWEVGDFDVTI